MLRRITLEKGDDPEDWHHKTRMKSTTSEFKDQVQKSPSRTTSSPIEKEKKKPNKHDATNMGEGRCGQKDPEKIF